MLLLRQLRKLTPPLTTRDYGKKALKANASTDKSQMKQVHQETLRHINPLARINIRSEIFLKVRAADVHEYPDADVFIAALHGGPVKNCTATMEVKVSDDEKLVDVKLSKVAQSTATDFHCELEVPIRANLNIETTDAVNVASIYSDEVCVAAQKNIKVKEIRAANISLCSEHGSIVCEGMLLGQCTSVETKQKGSISLDKLQGDKLLCKTKGGNVSTNSCYVEQSQFETDTGELVLKNVHKETKVLVHKKGAINMTGMHGNLEVRSNGGTMNLQLSEVAGHNTIVATNVELANINISDRIEEGAYVEVNASEISLGSSLSHLSDCLSADKRHFRMSRERDNTNKLIVTSRGSVELNKLSWADSMRQAMGLNV